MKEIWSLQPRFDQRSGKRPFALLEHPRFRAAYDFLVLRAESGEAPTELGGWWRRFMEAEPGAPARAAAAGGRAARRSAGAAAGRKKAPAGAAAARRRPPERA